MSNWVFPAGPEFIPYIAAVIGLIVCFEGIRQTFFSGSSSDAVKSKRMRLLNKGLSKKEMLNLTSDAGRSSALNRIPFFGSIPRKMRQAGMMVAPPVFIGACAFVVVLILIIGSFLAGPILAFGIALLAGFVIPFTIINIARKKRVERFAAQLPDALDLMMRGLRVGHPLNTTVANVAATMADPIGSEFGYMADQIAYGDTVSDAFTDLADRIDQEDMRYLAVSVSIQHGTGGNLAKMLATLSATIRGRSAMRRKVLAISSEGRISAILLSLLPFVIFAGTSLTAPDYYASVQEDPLFWPMAFAVILLVGINFFALRKVANFRV